MDYKSCMYGYMCFLFCNEDNKIHSYKYKGHMPVFAVFVPFAVGVHVYAVYVWICSICHAPLKRGVPQLHISATLKDLTSGVRATVKAEGKTSQC